jgi:hypothetical protein
MLGRALLVSLLGVACGVPPAESANSVTLVEPTPGDSAQAPAPPPAEAKVPEVEVRKGGVFLDGSPIGPRVEGDPRPLDGLLKVLKGRRAGFGDAPQPEYRLSFADDADAPTFKSAFQTAAFAGWLRASVATPERPVSFVPVGAAFGAPSPEADEITLLVRRDTVELRMARTIIGDHRPKEGPQGGLGLTGRAGAKDPSVIATMWRTDDSAGRGVDELRAFCGKAAPCSAAGLRVANDVTGAQLRGVLQAFGQACTAAEASECKLHFSILEPGAPNRPSRLVASGNLTKSGRLPPEQIQAVVRANFDQFRRCYEAGLAKNAELRGKVMLRFVIDRDGKVHKPEAWSGTTMPDAEVSACVVKALGSLVFPKPEGGVVTVVYPIVFEIGEDKKAPKVLHQ